jgi:signal transduction histidine kinase
VTIQDAVAFAEKQASRQGVSIRMESPAGLPVLRADSGQLKTCFINLLTNAIQAMPEGGEVRITARMEPLEQGEGGKPSLLTLRFADTGHGIPAEDRERVFAPYYSTRTTGFGLGLAITRKIVEDHGGRIYAADGDGAVMVVELPIPATAESPAVVHAASSVA